jgi:hypothetical protein
MTIGDEVEQFLATVVSERVFSVENWEIIQDGDVTMVTFCTAEGKASAVFNSKGLKDFIVKLQDCYKGA